MSQVIPNHVLRVGQTVCVASQEESKSLHPAGYPGCSTLRTQCCYSTDGWADPSTMVRAKAHLLPNGGLYRTHPAFEHVASHAQGKGQQDTSLERPNVSCQPKAEDTSVDPDAHVVSPTLDISIESLNQLILEIDPTFQPLTCKPVKDAVQPASQSDLAATKKRDPEATDFKYIEMTPARAKCPELLQGSPSPSGTPFSRSPQGTGFLPQKGGFRGNYSTNGSVVFSSPPGPESPRAGPLSCAASQTCSKASECIAIPQRCAAGQKDSISYGPSALLGTSPGLDNLLKPLHVVRAQQRTSGISLLSTSPGSDTSYVLGSSTYSLHNDDSDAHPAAGCSADCPSPAGSLGSPYPSSPSVRSHAGEAFGLGSLQPGLTCSTKANMSPSQKGQASSCPPSILNSTADIPVLLVNGCLERGDASPRLTRGPPASVKQSPPPSCGLSPGLGGLNNALSAPVLSCVSDSPLRDGQPTMKFVMDTSKYWFKPSITREQAIQLLKDKEPGTFIVRDSTSYRGSFGLAMKVLVSPSGSQTGDDSSDLVRHFLIESSAKGVHLKGASEELYFGSLSAFVYQHAITPLALPCKLSIPTRDLADGENSPDCAPESAVSLLKKSAVCNVLYLNSVNMETLTGAPAIQKAISSTFELETLPTPTLVHFKATEQGITLTDIQRKVFFRRHYPLAAIRFCGMDPENRKWQKYCRASRIFGFVAKSQTDSENLCHLFAEYDTVQPASLVIDFVRKLLPGL
ncbi:tensin-4 isoform X1 [Apteryx rowi]|uniref:tensin-4 isoform X1 n=1 Tax=Apteryx rowi TaxID=308060 RepID=UPI000E1C9CA0|nr:tensin-4 isoform X1 [Apteryx rowi]XP_025928642.1 tensin-4 isoform X1 [Apteryx rowi]